MCMVKLLIADDEKYDRDSIINIINNEFMEQLEISEARNGREVIEVFERVRPDIIITDIKMPGINGLKAIQEIRKINPNVFIIIITAYDYFDFAVEAVKNNVKEYILKPFSRVELIEKMKEAINFVNNEKQKRKNEIENQEKIYNLMPILENELSYSIINDTLYSIDYGTYLRYLEMNFRNGYAMVVQLNNLTNDESLKFKVGEYIKEYINHRYRTIGSYLFTKNLVYFIEVKSKEKEEVKADAIKLAADICREVKKVFGLTLNIGVGVCYEGLVKLHKSYEEACSSIEYKVQNNAVRYFGDVINDEEPANADSEKIALFKAVEQYIIDNIKEEIDLEKTAAKFNLSSYYFSRTFKEVLGYNYSDYVNIVRINKAKEFLLNKSKSIKEVCFLVGYSDPNYFSKVFKKYEGISPTEFKQNIN